MPIGLSSISAPAGSIACLRLFGGMIAAAPGEERLHLREPFLVQHQLDPGCLRRDLLRQIIHGGAQPAIHDHRIGPLASEPERLQQAARGRRPTVVPQITDQPDILQLLADDS